MRTALIVVDMQNDFLDERGYYQRKQYKKDGDDLTRPTAVPEERGFVPRDRGLKSVIDGITSAISSARDLRWPIVFLAATYGPGFGRKPRFLQGERSMNREYPCKPQTWGARLIAPIWELIYPPADRPDERNLENLIDELILEKHTFDGFFQTELAEFLRDRKVDRVFIVGTETHTCVLETAQSARHNEFEPVILEDCVWPPPAAKSRQHFDSAERELARVALDIFERGYGCIQSRERAFAICAAEWA